MKYLYLESAESFINILKYEKLGKRQENYSSRAHSQTCSYQVQVHFILFEIEDTYEWMMGEICESYSTLLENN